MTRKCWAPYRSPSTTATPRSTQDFHEDPPTRSSSFLTTASHPCVLVCATERHGYHSPHPRADCGIRAFRRGTNVRKKTSTFSHVVPCFFYDIFRLVHPWLPSIRFRSMFVLSAQVHHTAEFESLYALVHTARAIQPSSDSHTSNNFLSLQNKWWTSLFRTFYVIQ